MNIACPECSTVYRVDPGRVPDTGVAAECRTCGSAFRVDPSMGPTAPGEVVTAPRIARGAAEPDTAESAGEPAGSATEAVATEPGIEEAPGPEPTGAPVGAEATPSEGPDTGEREEQGGEVRVQEAAGRSGAGGTEPVEPAEAAAEAAPGSHEGGSGEGGAVEEEAGPATAAPATAEAPAFGPQDPDTRARRLARALVSDIKVYHPERWEESLEAGSLRTDFRDEILKSWEEYVEQVGEEMAKRTPYFRDALNEILAQGDRVF